MLQIVTLENKIRKIILKLTMDVIKPLFVKSADFASVLEKTRRKPEF